MARNANADTMTLIELTDKIEALAKANPLCRYAESGATIYNLNNRTVRDYAAVYISPDGTHTIGANMTTYALTIFYIDRLADDLRNEQQIFSTAIAFLRNLIRGVRDLDGVISVGDTMTAQNFIEKAQEKMSDKCAGAYITVQVSVRNDSDCFL